MVSFPVIIYVNKVPNLCSRRLVKYLKKKGYVYSKKFIESEESQIALKYHGHVDAEAPIVQMGPMFFYGHRLFNRNTMKLETLSKDNLKEYAQREEDVKQGIQVSQW